MSSDAIELRVLHGPQAGARLPLQPGQSYTMGAADTCAIVLVGAQIAQEHARISVDEAAGMLVEPLQGQVLTLAGQEIEAGPVPLGTVLQFGFVKLTAALAGDEWPADEVLQMRSAPNEPVEETGQDPSDDGTSVPEPLPEPSPHADVEERKPQRVGARRYAICAAVLVLVGGIAFTAVQRSNDANAGAMATAPDEEEAQVRLAAEPEMDLAPALAEVLKSFPKDALNAKQGDGGAWVVEGRLQTEAELQKLRQRVSTLKVPVELKVMLEAERLATLKRFVQSRHSPGKLELRVEQGAGDVLRILGAASSAEEAAAFPEQARRELAALEPIEFEILHPQQVRALFMEGLRDAGLGGKFEVTASEPALELRAVLTPRETRTWEAFFVEFTRRHGSAVKIGAHVEPARDPVAAQVAAVVGGAFPYIVTTGGQRIAPGGMLGGHTVVSVRDGEIALSDGTRVRYGL